MRASRYEGPSGGIRETQTPLHLPLSVCSCGPLSIAPLSAPGAGDPRGALQRCSTQPQLRASHRPGTQYARPLVARAGGRLRRETTASGRRRRGPGRRRRRRRRAAFRRQHGRRLPPGEGRQVAHRVLVLHEQPYLRVLPSNGSIGTRRRGGQARRPHARVRRWEASRGGGVRRSDGDADVGVPQAGAARFPAPREGQPVGLHRRSVHLLAGRAPRLQRDRGLPAGRLAPLQVAHVQDLAALSVF